MMTSHSSANQADVAFTKAQTDPMHSGYAILVHVGRPRTQAKTPWPLTRAIAPIAHDVCTAPHAHSARLPSTTLDNPTLTSLSHVRISEEEEEEDEEEVPALLEPLLCVLLLLVLVVE